MTSVLRVLDELQQRVSWEPDAPPTEPATEVEQVAEWLRYPLEANEDGHEVVFNNIKPDRCLGIRSEKRFVLKDDEAHGWTSDALGVTGPSGEVVIGRDSERPGRNRLTPRRSHVLIRTLTGEPQTPARTDAAM